MFEWYQVGSREGEIVLAQCSQFDTDYDSKYTIKKYHGEKTVTAEGWHHNKIQLLPLNKNYDVKELDEESGPRTVGVLKCVLS